MPKRKFRLSNDYVIIKADVPMEKGLIYGDAALRAIAQNNPKYCAYDENNKTLTLLKFFYHVLIYGVLIAKTIEGKDYKGEWFEF